MVAAGLTLLAPRCAFYLVLYETKSNSGAQRVKIKKVTSDFERGKKTGHFDHPTRNIA